ncbi:site-specific integrase [Pseudomonas sp. NPDC087336]|uniref:site-specific integrase n=1 Tax=Pseudomonas sp. NPDC087336 TaxID=3364436 RepID=UPI0037F9DB45
MTSQSRKSQGAELKTGSFISLDGKHLNVNDARWRLSRDVLIDFEVIEQLVSSDVFKGYVSTLAAFAADSSANYVSNLHWYYVYFLRFGMEPAIDTKKTIAYREYLGTDREYYLLPVRALFTRWRALGNAGIDHDVVDMLDAWRIKGNIKGDAVKRLDLEEGPLSDFELQGLLEKTVLAYEAGSLNVTETSLLMLAAASARRPIQLTSLKLKDLYDRPGTDGFSHYIVNLPRAKQGGAFRSSFRELEITQELWGALEVQKEFSINVFKQYLCSDLSEDSRRELPLFFNPQALAEKVALNEFDRLNLGDFFHMHASRVSQLLKRAVKVANIHSERTGEMLHINARRLRYTLGCRAAREGYGVLVIAELLDQSDTQNAHVYTLNVPEHAARIDAAVGHQLAPYARAFAGMLVDTKEQARRGNIPGSDIRDFAGKGTGTCGHGGACGANVPIPCYTCPHFQPWLEGPHHLIYVRLIEERDEVARTTADPAIAAVLDRTIVAVAEVIQACVNRKEQLRGAGEGTSHD